MTLLGFFENDLFSKIVVSFIANQDKLSYCSSKIKINIIITIQP